MGELLSDRSNTTFSKPYAARDRSGYIYVAPFGTPLPKSPHEALHPNFNTLGYISEDGLTEPSTFEEGDTFTAAGGDTIAQSDPKFTKKWTGKVVEVLNPEVLKLVYGEDNVTVGQNFITINERSFTPKSLSFVVDEVLRDKRVRRSVITSGTFIMSGDTVHKDNEIMGFEFTISAYNTASAPAQRIFIDAPQVESIKIVDVATNQAPTQVEVDGSLALTLDIKRYDVK